MKTLNLKHLLSIASLFAMIMGVIFLANAKTDISTIAKPIVDEPWFNVVDDPSGPYLTDVLSGGPSGTCSEFSGTICAIQLDFEGANQDTLEDLLAQMDDGNEPNPTLQDFINAGASVKDSKHRL